MARLHQAGVAVRELAERFGVSRRTVYRIIAPRSDRASYE
jgi:predicted DNA-binding transcriptional regulator YafY